MKKSNREKSPLIEAVCAYICGNERLELPDEVMDKAKHHILDTLSAVVSGSTLKPGKRAKKYVKSQGGVEEALVAGSQIITSAINAAFANAMMAHADETDDSNARSRMHPGCAIVPAALAAAEREGADGMRFLKAVVIAYDIGCRVTQALDADKLHEASRSSHSIGGNFGAASAAASILRLNKDQIRYVLSYAVQQASGVTSLYRDEEHTEKAFVFAGMPARNGVTAAILIESGFTGVWDSFSGEHNFFKAFSPSANPEQLRQELGSRFEIMHTNLKKFSVGSPIQAPLDALLLLIEKHSLSSDNVQSIIARLPAPGARVVDNPDMPNINLQYILAATLLDGDLTFKTAHSYERMNDPAIQEVKRKIQLIEDHELSAAKIGRQGIIEVTAKDGNKFREHVVSVRGTAANPMSAEEVEKKSMELLTPTLGPDRSQTLIEKIWNLERVNNIRELRSFLSA